MQNICQAVAVLKGNFGNTMAVHFLAYPAAPQLAYSEKVLILIKTKIKRS